MTWLDRQAKRIFLAAADTITHGSIEIVCPDRTYAFAAPGPGPAAMLVVHDERTFRRAILEGDRGLGEAYMDGDWSSPDLVALLRLALRNTPSFNRLNGALSSIARGATRVRHWLRSNTRAGSRANIQAHYDLGNEFFRLFLDRDLLYSSAWFDDEDDSLEEAQRAKLDRLCRKLCLGPDDHLLEIGSGWGALAAYAAAEYGCRVTTTTISREQFEHTRERVAGLGAARGLVDVLFDDYRDLRGRYSKIVSVEMFEAVGLAHYDDFFAACDRLTGPTGAVLIQAITIGEQDFQRTYGHGEDWMQGHIFPGSELACLSEMLRAIGRVTSFRPFDLEDLGTHYARTLTHWRARFHARRDDVLALGFDERFVRMWDLYLAYSEAGFAERHISDIQLLLTRAYHDGRHFGEPGQVRSAKEVRSTRYEIRSTKI